LTRPFDMSFVRAMILTMNDLMAHFSARTGYCHSDEITLIFAPANPALGQSHLYAGRIQKLASVAAAAASVRFNHHFQRELRRQQPPHIQHSKQQQLHTDPSPPMHNSKQEQPHSEPSPPVHHSKQEQPQSEPSPPVHHSKQQQQDSLAIDLKTKKSERVVDEKMREAKAGAGRDWAEVLAKAESATMFFDGRVVAFPPDKLHELANHMIWRSQFDCRRNAVSAFARVFWKSKTVMGWTTKESIAKLAERGLEWARVPPFLTIGVFAKRAPKPSAPNPDPRKRVDAGALPGSSKIAGVPRICSGFSGRIANRCWFVRADAAWVSTLLAPYLESNSTKPLPETLVPAKTPKDPQKLLEEVAATPPVLPPAAVILTSPDPPTQVAAIPPAALPHGERTS